MKKSCELCKARKVRCDRKEPSCGWCQRNDRTCIYKERKRSALQTNYGHDVEDKINTMEASLHHLVRRVEDHISNDHEVDQQRVFSEAKHTALPHHADERAQTSPQLYSSSSTHDGTFNSPRSAAPSVPSLMDTTIPHASTPINNLGSTWLQASTDLPPYHMLYDLIDLFFKHIITWAPILDRRTTFDVLSGVPSPLNEEDYILLHAIVVTTLRFCKDPDLTPQLRTRYHKISKQKVQVFALRNPGIKSLQALALVAVDVLGTSEGPEGYNLLALLARSVVQLDLGVEKSVFLESSPSSTYSGHCWAVALPRPRDWIEEEGRRRLVWMVYMLDRYATIATQLDFAMNEHSTDTPLPCRYDLFCNNVPSETRWFSSPGSMEIALGDDANLGSFSYHCEVLRILSRIHRFLQQPMDILSPRDVQRWRNNYRKLDGELNTWLSGLPGEYGNISQLCHSDPAARISNWIMIHAAFVVSVIRLHSTVAYPVVQSHIFKPSHNAMQRCLTAIESLRVITRDVIEAGSLDLLGSPFAFALWVAARLSLVHAATMQCDVDPNIWFLINTLERMGQCWAVARSYARTLSRFVRRGQKDEADAMAGGYSSPGATFAAMQRRAYELTTVASHRRHTVLEPASTQMISDGDFELLDIFRFFHYPCLASTVESVELTNTIDDLSSQMNTVDSDWGSHHPSSAMTANSDETPSFVATSPESDWLDFRLPYIIKPWYV